MLTVGSLFAGIGGMDLGLERAGMTIKWQCEIDPYCLKVLEKHWPDVKRYGDIREVDWNAVERVDLVCGGFPCQDISFAGKRKGLTGQRSTLWSEFYRAICKVRPKWVLVENVPGLLSSDDGQFLGAILRDLAACGYDAEWDCIPAATFGAPHLRDRFYLVAYPNGLRLQAHAVEGRILHKTTSGNGNNGHALTEFRKIVFPPFPTQEQMEAQPDYVGVDYGIPHAIHRLRGLGNAVVPQVVQWIGERILALELLVDPQGKN